MTELPGEFIGCVLADRYELTSVLGQGQGGMVFKARHRHLDRFVAVKMFPTQTLSDKIAYMRFEREAHSVGRLNHPHIVTVFDVGRWNNERPFLVMDYIEGQDLQELMGKEGRLPIARCLNICIQICSALHHAHKRGVIHRDLKPRNIMVIEDEDIHDFVKLVDFGLAKQSNELSSEALTMDGYVMGTPQYMSPEQCKSGKIDARTDIYALCSVLFKTLTGTYPIHGGSWPEIMNNQIHQKPLSFEEAGNAKVPIEIQRVVYKGLAKNPDERQASMAQLRAELKSAAERSVVVDQDSLGRKVTHEVPKAVEYNVDILRISAKGGDLQSQFELVLRLEFGQGGVSHQEEAQRWLKQAASQGMKEAQFRLGDHYLRGEAGFTQNANEAVIWLSKSAEQGYDLAQFALGWCYEFALGTTEDLRLATSWYRKAAKQGNTQATEQLRGLVQRVQDQSTLLSGSEASLQGEITSSDPETLYALACRVRDSCKPGDPKKTKAAVLFQQAAHFGHELAQLAYIKLLLADSSNAKGQAEAAEWLEKASTEHNQIAMLMLAACLRNALGCRVDTKRAQQLLEDLAKAPFNMSAAQATLGTSLLTGDGVQRNIPRGIALLKAAADSDDAFGQWKMGICLRTGVGVMKDAKAAELMFQKSAESNFPQGIDELWKPIALPFTDAVQIFKALSAIGNTNAFLWLGICYEKGYGVERDLNIAMNHYEQAHSKGRAAIERIKVLLSLENPAAENLQNQNYSNDSYASQIGFGNSDRFGQDPPTETFN